MAASSKQAKIGNSDPPESKSTKIPRVFVKFGWFSQAFGMGFPMSFWVFPFVSKGFVTCGPYLMAFVRDLGFSLSLKPNSKTRPSAKSKKAARYTNSAGGTSSSAGADYMLDSLKQP